MRKLLSRSALALLCVSFAVSGCSLVAPNEPPKTQPIYANIRPSSDPTVNPEVTLATTPPNKNISSRDQECLAEAMYFEARGTGESGMRAVGEVILNRRDSKKFPNTVCGVVDQRYKGSCQFSYRCDGRPEVYAERGQKVLADQIAQTLLTNRGADITKGSLFFHSKRMKPGWFASLDRRGQFGGNIFYR